MNDPIQKTFHSSWIITVNVLDVLLCDECGNTIEKYCQLAFSKEHPNKRYHPKCSQLITGLDGFPIKKDN